MEIPLSLGTCDTQRKCSPQVNKRHLSVKTQSIKAFIDEKCKNSYM